MYRSLPPSILATGILFVSGAGMPGAAAPAGGGGLDDHASPTSLHV